MGGSSASRARVGIGFGQPSVEILEPPEEEEAQWYDEDPNGIHNMMAYMVQDQTPTFIWTSQCNAVNYQQLWQDQAVNHFAGIGAFTTKEGLCSTFKTFSGSTKLISPPSSHSATGCQLRMSTKPS